MKRPNLFIVGQSKSGTSALYYFLRQHPDIYMSTVKEPFYFCKDIIKESDTYHGRRVYFDYRSEEKYLSLFADAGDERIVGESTTTNICSKVAAEEIWKFNPESKVLIMLREPVSFVVSLHNEHYRKGLDDINDFSSAITLEKDRKIGKNIPPNCYCPSLLFFSDRIKYYEQVRRYLARFGPSHTKVIIYEDFKENNDKVCKEILKFLGIDPDFFPEIDKINVSKMPRWGKINTLIMSSSVKRMIQTILPDSIYALFKPVGRRILWENKLTEPIDETLRKKLMKQYKPEVLKISKLLGRNLVKKWGYDMIE